MFCGQSCTTRYVAGIGGSGRSSAVGLYLTSYYLGGSVGAAPVYDARGWTGGVALLAAVLTLSIGVAAFTWRGRDVTAGDRDTPH